ncbi:MAG: hypothetical protein CL916_01245 [Deltaproteobacteria bacterium]|nr:hypothetical protein [Deltaproteobacteria bacterium]
MIGLWLGVSDVLMGNLLYATSKSDSSVASAGIALTVTKALSPSFFCASDKPLRASSGTVHVGENAGSAPANPASIRAVISGESPS